MKQFIFDSELVIKSATEDDKGKFHVVGFAATKDYDLQGDVISDEAMEHSKEDLLKNSTVLLNHEDGTPIGRVVKQTLNKKGMIIDAIIDQTSKMPDTGALVVDLIKQGILNKFSIRARVMDSAREFVAAVGRTANVIKRMLLLEASLVSVPANPAAEAMEWYVSKAFTAQEGDDDMKKKTDLTKALTHNSVLAEDEPLWGDVNKTELPRNAHADEGEADKKSSWSYPHHFVKDGGDLNDDGVFTTGDEFLHKGGLVAAWAAAQGARSGEEASDAVKAHLEEHRVAIGLSEKDLQDAADQLTKDADADADKTKDADDADTDDKTKDAGDAGDAGDGSGDDAGDDKTGDAGDADKDKTADAGDDDADKTKTSDSADSDKSTTDKFKGAFPTPQVLKDLWSAYCKDKGLSKATDKADVFKHWLDFCKEKEMPFPFPFPYPEGNKSTYDQIAEIADDLMKNADEIIQTLGEDLKGLVNGLLEQEVPEPDMAASLTPDADKDTSKDADGDDDDADDKSGDGDDDADKDKSGDDDADGDGDDDKTKNLDKDKTVRKGLQEGPQEEVLKSMDDLQKKLESMGPDERLRYLLKLEEDLQAQE